VTWLKFRCQIESKKIYSLAWKVASDIVKVRMNIFALKMDLHDWRFGIN